MRYLAAALLLACAAPAAAGSVTSRAYGVTSDGKDVAQFILVNDSGMEVRLITYGGIVTDVVVPDRGGKRANVVLGFASLADYEAKNANYDFGAIVGRYAGRISNARFTVDGKEVRLTANDGTNALHGGPGGIDREVWTGRPFSKKGTVGAILELESPAGDQGFPGKLSVRVIYTLGNDNSLRIDFEARTDAPTVLNLTNHSYFNLAGAGSGSVRDHLLRIDADKLMGSDGSGAPTGGFLPVRGTPFDFTAPARVGVALDADHPQLEGRRGLNHAWLLRGGAGRLRRVAALTDPASGRHMEVRSTEPSLHVYTGNWFSGEDKGAQGTPYRPYDGIALETQHLADSPNRPDFPTTLLRPGKRFHSTTIYRFSTCTRGC
ncbi:MAG TPA: aldose epimerase family protein [Allosphingosinicella sp.]